MKEVLKHIELIENYVEGRLSDNERQDFETRLIVDSDFKEEFDLYNNIVSGIKASGLENLKAKLKEADDELDSNNIIELKPENKNSSRLYLSIAASLVLILGIAFIWKINSSNDLSGMANSIYEKDKGLPTEMAVSASVYNEPINNYKNDNYEKAKALLLPLFKEKPNNDTANFCLGIVEYELKNYKESENYFNAITSQSSFYSKAEYRLLLVYLKLNSLEHAKITCKQILTNPNHPYFDKVQLISKELLSKEQ